MVQYRYQPLPLSKQPGEFQPYASNIEELATTSFGDSGKILTYRDPSGGLIGPFPVLIASKQVGTLLTDTFKAFSCLESIPSDAKEVAILVTGARFGTLYEQYAHREIATRTAGLSKEQVASIKAHQKPNGLSEAASMAYDASYSLANERGPLPESLYNSTVKVLGKEGTLLMAHYVGMYCYMCVLMNVANAPLPEGEV